MSTRIRVIRLAINARSSRNAKLELLLSRNFTLDFSSYISFLRWRTNNAFNILKLTNFQSYIIII